MADRCEPCESGRRDGLPCDLETCRCRCHREGKRAVEALADATLDKARAVPRRRRVGPQAWVETIQLSDIVKPEDKLKIEELGGSAPAGKEE